MNLTLIRAEIKNHGFKHIWVAYQINVHPTTLCRFLAGKTALRENALNKLLELLDLKLETLKNKAS